MAPQKYIYNSWAKSKAVHVEVHCCAFFSFNWEPAMHKEGPIMLCDPNSVGGVFKVL